MTRDESIIQLADKLKALDVFCDFSEKLNGARQRNEFISKIASEMIDTLQDVSAILETDSWRNWIDSDSELCRILNRPYKGKGL